MTVGKAPYDDNELVELETSDPELWRELQDWGTDYIVPDDPKRDTPCPYLDMGTKRCKIQEMGKEKPDVCSRGVVVGEMYCIKSRRREGIKPHDPLEIDAHDL